MDELKYLNSIANEYCLCNNKRHAKELSKLLQESMCGVRQSYAVDIRNPQAESDSHQESGNFFNSKSQWTSISYNGISTKIQSRITNSAQIGTIKKYLSNYGLDLNRLMILEHLKMEAE